jgi:enterochelin esterase family protein
VVNALPGRDSSEAMTHLPGTDLWYRTYKVRNDTRESYQFAIAGNNVTDEPGWNNFLIGARYMRDVLRAKGYTVHYSEFSGGHNPMNWQGTLANGLLALFGEGG